jgi:hypothetical protein
MAVMIPLMWINPRYREMAPILTVLVVGALGISAVQGSMAIRSALRLFRSQQSPPGQIQLATLAAIASGIVGAMWAFLWYVFTFVRQ